MESVTPRKKLLLLRNHKSQTTNSNEYFALPRHSRICFFSRYAKLLPVGNNIAVMICQRWVTSDPYRIKTYLGGDPALADEVIS